MASGVLHVRYNGLSHDLHMGDLDLGNLSSDEQVKQAAATMLDVSVSEFRAYTVEREGENLTLRPSAVFG